MLPVVSISVNGIFLLYFIITENRDFLVEILLFNREITSNEI